MMLIYKQAGLKELGLRPERLVNSLQKSGAGRLLRDLSCSPQVSSPSARRSQGLTKKSIAALSDFAPFATATKRPTAE